MNTLSKFLNNKQNQTAALGKIFEAMKDRGEWGLYGIFTVIGKKTGFTPAYVGQVLTGKRPLTESFFEKMAEYLEVHHSWLQGEFTYGYDEARELYRGLWGSSGTVDDKQQFLQNFQRKVAADLNQYRGLINTFCKIPFEERDRALKILQGIQEKDKHMIELGRSTLTPPAEEE